MAELQGSAAKAAYRQAVLWGTAVTLGDGDQVEYATESIVPDVQLVESDQINGEALSGASETGAVTVQGELAGMDLKYSGHERFFRAVFGSETPSADGAGYKHKFDFELSNEGEFGTLAFEKVVDAGTHSIHEIDSWKPMGATFTGAAGQPVKLTVRGIGRQLQPGESAANVASTSWTLPGKGAAVETRRLVKFGQCVIEVANAPVALPATGTITYTDTDATATKIVTLDSAGNARVYTFRASGNVASNGDVEIVAGNADATMLNLVRAINNSGGTNGAGEDYLVASAHPTVSAALDAINNVVTITARLAGTAGNSIVFTTDEAEFTLNGAGTLADTGTAGTPSYTALCASGFSLSFQRNGEPVQTTCDGDYASEPSTDTVEITGTIDFPIYDDDNHFLVEANISKAVLSLRFTFTSLDEYDSGKPYKHVILIPGAQLQGGYPNVGGKGRVPLSVTWKAHNAAAAVDTDATMPRLYVYNATADIDDFGNS